ncbi:hypothetical protein CDIK_2414 [Cucumispora dikerogammari]|nr:hypothetical protein CDIK_2414 [Cucumispora dikerogammari]
MRKPNTNSQPKTQSKSTETKRTKASTINKNKAAENKAAENKAAESKSISVNEDQTSNSNRKVINKKVTKGNKRVKTDNIINNSDIITETNNISNNITNIDDSNINIQISETVSNNMTSNINNMSSNINNNMSSNINNNMSSNINNNMSSNINNNNSRASSFSINNRNSGNNTNSINDRNSVNTVRGSSYITNIRTDSLRETTDASVLLTHVLNTRNTTNIRNTRNTTNRRTANIITDTNTPTPTTNSNNNTDNNNTNTNNISTRHTERIFFNWPFLDDLELRRIPSTDSPVNNITNMDNVNSNTPTIILSVISYGREPPNFTGTRIRRNITTVHNMNNSNTGSTVPNNIRLEISHGRGDPIIIPTDGINVRTVRSSPNIIRTNSTSRANTRTPGVTTGNTNNINNNSIETSSLVDFLFSALSPLFDSANPTAGSNINSRVNVNMGRDAHMNIIYDTYYYNFDYSRLRDYKEKVAAMKRVKYGTLLNDTNSNPNNNSNIERSCLVCLDAFKLINFVYVLRCSHVFHIKCVGAWLKSSDICPVCRQDVISDAGVDIVV